MQVLRSAKFWQGSSLLLRPMPSVSTRGGSSLANKNTRLTMTTATTTPYTTINSMHRSLALSSSMTSSRQLHQLACRAGGSVLGGSHILARGATGISHNDNNIPLNPLFVSPLGAVSHFSSLGGGGGPPRPSGGSRVAQGVGLLGAASVLFGKTKYVLAALKFTKLASLGSMVLSIGTYSMFFGLPYAAGMVGLIAIHEAGHAAVLHHKGIPFSPAVFVPFMGAAIVTKQLPRDAWEDAVVGYGGPALGSLGAAGVAVAAHLTDSQLLYALADFGFMINLFNLLPIGSMDGGRICGAISPYIGVAGIGLGGALAYTGHIHNPIFYLILLSGGYETFMRFYDPSHLPPNYYRIPTWRRASMTVAYFGLIAALLAAMDANQKYRKPPEALMREQQEKTWDMR